MELKNTKMKERRYRDSLTLVERRKGKVWMHLEIALCLTLAIYLLWILR
jgi:hypothetical protein